MVIKIDERNQELYNKFFEEAYTDAKTQGINVPAGQSAFSSLWQYFYYLPELGRKIPQYYTKLPLDEPMMEIDGDSREIKVPAQLIKCAGIENDHMAESIMFLIDRYHDGKDLTNAQIWIQWKAADDAEGRVNVPHIDADFAQNKIRFPWPLTSEVTSHPGIIEFSVVFFMMSETTENVAYRYSTLPQRIRIEPALQADLGSNPTEVGGNFASAVRRNSYGPGFYQPVRPYFTVSQGGLDLGEVSDLNYISTDANIQKFGELVLRAQATVTDTGSIAYGWKHIVPKGTIEFDCGANKTKILSKGTAISKLEKEFINAYKTSLKKITLDNGNEKEEELSKLSSVLNSESLLTEKIKITYTFGTVALKASEGIDKTHRNKFDRYYKTVAEAENSNNDNYIVESEWDDITSQVYERYTVFTLPSGETGKNKPVTGKYFAVAKNSIYSETDAEYKYSPESISTKTVLTSPNEVHFSNTTFETVVFDENSSVNLDTELIQVDGETYIASIIKNTTSNTGFPKKANGTLDFTDGDEQTIANDGTIEILKNISSAKENSSGTGWYTAEITAKRNRETKSEITKVWRVINEVEAPQIVNATIISEITNPNISKIEMNPDTINNPNEYEVYMTDGAEATLKVGFRSGTSSVTDVATYYGTSTPNSTNSLLSDGFIFQWTKISPDNNETIITETGDSITIKGYPKNTLVKCEFTNTLNGMSEKSSLIFNLR